MSYVLVGILFLVIAACFVTYLVMTATKRSSPAREDGAVGIGADEHTPLGDTDQHAGEQNRSGETVTPNDAGRSGGTGRPVGLEGPGEEVNPAGRAPEGRFQRDPIGGEAEARPFVETDRS
jgi:hypothetical protein